MQGGTSAEDVARHTVTFGQQKVFEGSLVEDKKGPDGSEGQYSEYLPMYWAAGVKAAKGDYVGNDYVIPAKINWSSIKVRGLPYDHALRDLDETDKMFNPRDLVKVVGRPIIVDGKDVVIEYRDPHTNTVFKGPALMIEEIEHIGLGTYAPEGLVGMFLDEEAKARHYKEVRQRFRNSPGLRATRRHGPRYRG